MAEYTYDNILINPLKEGIENLIGEEVYFHNNPSLCLDYANKKLTGMSGVLVEIRKDDPSPFVIKKDDFIYSYNCIIKKRKESKPKYVPFQDGREFFNSYLSVESRLEKEDYFLSNHGIWLKDKDIDGVSYIVTEIWKDGVVLGSDQLSMDWDKLLEYFTFLDGSPCGKLMEE